MTPILRFTEAVERDPAIARWMIEKAGMSGPLGAIAHKWFGVMRALGDDVRETLHDGFPYVCLGDAPFAYVNVFTAHANVGFVYGAALPDPAGLLQGTGRLGRHVKVRPGETVHSAALSALIDAAYVDIRSRVYP